MQPDRLEGWMVRQVERSDLAAETSAQSPSPKTLSRAPLLTRVKRSTAATPRRSNDTCQSVVTVSGQEEGTSLPSHVFLAPVNNSDFPSRRIKKSDEKLKERWRTGSYDQRLAYIEGNCVDRTKVLHNLLPNQREADKLSPLLLRELPREHILESIYQSVLSTPWTTSRRPLGELEAMTSEIDEAARVRRVVADVLATAPSNIVKKHKSPRAPFTPRNQYNSAETDLSHYKGGELTSPRIRNVLALSATILNPRVSRVTSRSEESKIQKFIAELRADPALWAAFQHDVEQIQQQYRRKNDICDKIRVNKELARTPRSVEDHESRKKQTAERMERTRHQREHILQLRDKQLEAKREKYIRRVNPSQFLSAADLEQSVHYRRRKMWLHVASFVVVSHRWHQQLVQSKGLKAMARIRSIAAATIQRIWRKWKRQYASQHTVVVYTWLRKSMWKKLLRLRCRRKGRQALLIRHFILDHCSVSNARRNLNLLMVQWRRKVIRAQRASRSFVVCKRARLQALSIWFDNTDHERLRMDRQVSNEERRLTGRKDSMSSNFGSGNGVPGSASAHRPRRNSVVVLGGMDEKRVSTQMLITPMELQRLQQSSIPVVKIPKVIKWQLLAEFLAESRNEFQQKQQAYREKLSCAVHTREVKLEEARAIFQGSLSWNKTAETNTPESRSKNKAIQPPCFSLFSDLNAAKRMEDLVRRGVQLTLEADPELRSLIARQQEQRLQIAYSPSRRSIVSFSGAAVSPPAGLATTPTSSPPRRQSILKKSA